MQWFRKLLTAMLVAVTAWSAAVPPAAAYGPLPLGSPGTPTAISCDAACDDCTNNCGTQAACPASCVRLPGQPLAQIEAPSGRRVVLVGIADHPAGESDFTSRAIRPLLPPPRG
jgi:hypothetical protein